MRIQVDTDDHASGRKEVALQVEAPITDVVDRFRERITRIELHSIDENSGKPGDNDKRCLTEARLAGRKPVALTHAAGSLEEAFGDAAESIKRALASALGRIERSQGRDSILEAAVLDGGSPSIETGRPRGETRRAPDCAGPSTCAGTAAPGLFRLEGRDRHLAPWRGRLLDDGAVENIDAAAHAKAKHRAAQPGPVDHVQH
jgi:hypothetical protein